MADIVWDYDYIKYTIGSIAEKRSIVATHRQSGDQVECKTRTEFYGHHLKKSGGWLAEHNLKRLTPIMPDEFDIVDVQTPEPVKFALRAVDAHIDGVTERIGSRDYYGYIGKGDSWRVEASTILKYKGQREGSLRPIHLEAIEEHLIKKHDAQIVRGKEADDQVVIDCTANKKLILIGVDKDYSGCELILFNPDKMVKPEKISGFGKLYIGSDKKVRGEGRIFLYHQVLAGDSSDNYCANSATDMKWGEKASYSLLSKCSNDKQAFEALIEGYKTLYPEPKEIVGWRGDTIKVDAMYVMQENFTMAHMLRKDGDFFNVKAVLTKLGIPHD
jgi:hypothetical protein